MTNDQIVRGFRSWFPVVSTTDEEFARFVFDSDVERTLALLMKSGYSDLGKVSYILGSGGQPKSTYSELKRQNGVHVVDYRSLLPPGLRWLPGYRGLVRIDDPSKLFVVFDQVVSQSTAIVYIFDHSLETSFLEAVKHGKEPRDYSFGVKKDPGYLIYLVDEDRDDSPTGAVEFLSFHRSASWKSELLVAERDSLS